MAAPQAVPARQPGPSSPPPRPGGLPGPGAARSSRVTAIAASVAGLVVLHDQGPCPAGGGIDLYLALVPVLVAVPVVVVMLRLYPLIIRGLLAVSARGAGRHRLRPRCPGRPGPR